MNNPKPEHRITAVEKRVTHIEGAIEELSADTAESLKDLKQDTTEIKQTLDKISGAFVLEAKDIEIIKTTMATKDDIKNMATKDDLSQLKNEIKSEITAMETRLIDAMKQLLQQKSGD